MTLLWLLIWFLAGQAALTLDPVNAWTATLILQWDWTTAAPAGYRGGRREAMPAHQLLEKDMRVEGSEDAVRMWSSARHACVPAEIARRLGTNADAPAPRRGDADRTFGPVPHRGGGAMRPFLPSV